MARAEGVPDDQRQLGDDAVADGVDELGAPADDPRALGVAADVEAVDVLDEQQGDPRLVAVEDEPRGLVGAVAVDDAAELVRATPLGAEPEPLVGHDPQGKAAQPGEPANEGLADTRRGTRRGGPHRPGAPGGRGRRTAPRGRS